jgi:hypothetical protein
MLCKITHILTKNQPLSKVLTVSSSKLNGLHGLNAKNSISKSLYGQKLKILQKI